MLMLLILKKFCFDYTDKFMWILQMNILHLTRCVTCEIVICFVHCTIMVKSFIDNSLNHSLNMTLLGHFDLQFLLYLYD